MSNSYLDVHYDQFISCIRFISFNFHFAAFQGAEAVFHMAAPDSSINNFQLHYSVNVEGIEFFILINLEKVSCSFS